MKLAKDLFISCPVDCLLIKYFHNNKVSKLIRKNKNILLNKQIFIAFLLIFPNHFNPFTIYYDSDTKEWKELALLPVLPTFCYRIFFRKKPEPICYPSFGNWR